MKIAIIGTGNLAFHLAKRLKDTGNPPSLIISRSIYSGQSLTNLLELGSASISTEINQECDLILLAIPDHQISNQQIDEKYCQKSIMLHLSGSQDISTLNKFKNHGVLYPLQTFSKGHNVNWEEIPLLIEGNSHQTFNKIQEFARLLSKKVVEVNSEDRLRVHLSAVLSCNFSNYLYQMAQKHLEGTGIEFSDLNHLLQETVDKASAIGAEKAQTGPAIRGDQQTIKKHLEILMANNSEKDLYRLISKSINPNLDI